MRILVAEDDALCRTLLVRMLRDMGHEVTAVLDGEAAWDAFRREPFAVVVTDWMMPECDGIELTRRIRTVRTRSYTWIVMLTGMDFAANYRQAMEAGVDDFLVKPLDHDLLRVRLTVAERVQRMNAQVVALTSALPICMHCKAVRDGSDHWKRVEEYFHDIDFSHSYCPDCFYEHSLRAELVRLRADPQWAARLPAPSERVTLDPAVLAVLREFERADSPGLVEDMLSSFAECSEVLRQDLYGFGASGLLGGDVVERLRRFTARCADLGLGRLGTVLARITTLKAEEQIGQHVELASAAAAELDLAVAALGEASSAGAAGAK
ncbi:MAG TPA: response regulator [Planctomycetota bacterium]|nr:response regulator [Planctomycetota bacterium]